MKLRTLAAGLGLAAATIAIGSNPVSAQDGNPFERGPDPTQASIRAGDGPFATAQVRVTGARGFGGGTIYHPTDTSSGTFGGVVIAPGYTAGSSSYSGIAERVASHGFVVMAIDTNTRLDLPPSRGDQIEAALDHLTSNSAVSDLVDPARLAVSGHSMGGGGALEVGRSGRDDVRASVPLTPWHLGETFPETGVPTLIVAAENDTIAPVGTHARPFYESFPDGIESAYVELDGESHLAPIMNPDDLGAPMVSWLKRYVDDDTRYEQFLCPAPSGRDYSDWQDSCPGDDAGTPPTTTTPPPAEDDCDWWELWC